jgi:hypothetical protein
MQANHAVGSARCGRHRGNGETRRVRREDRAWRRDRVQLAPERVLRVEIFDDGLDDDVGAREVRDARGEREPRERRVSSSLVSLPFSMALSATA